MSVTVIAGELFATAQALVADGKGLLAIDESTHTCNQRFAAVGIAPTVEARRAYRELIVTTPGLGESISGAILYDETIHQHTTDGIPFVQVLDAAGIIVGIEVDTAPPTWPVISARRSPRAWTGWGIAWRSTRSSARGSLSGGRC